MCTHCVFTPASIVNICVFTPVPIVQLFPSDLMVNAMLVHQGWATATDPAVSDAADELASAKKDRVFEICDVKFGSSHAVSVLVTSCFLVSCCIVTRCFLVLCFC